MGPSVVVNKVNHVDMENDKCEYDVDVTSYLVRRALPFYDGVYVQGKLEGTDVLMTIDTGASVTLVSTETYEQLPAKTRPSLLRTARRVRAADGEDLVCMGTAQLRLQLGEELVTGDFVIADIQDDVLLGADVLQKDESGPVDLLLSENRMIFRGHSIPLQQVVSPLKPQNYKVRLVDDCEVPGMSELNVEVTIDPDVDADKGDLLVVEAHPRLAQKHSVVLARAVIEVPEGHSVRVVRILNPFQVPSKLYKGTVLGSAEGGAYLMIEPGEEDEVVRAVSLDLRDSIDERNAAESGNRTSMEVPPHLKDLFEQTCEAMSVEEEAAVKDLLVSFADVFSTHEDDLGLTHLIEHVIDTKDAAPIKHPPRRVPLAYAGEDKKALDQMLRRGCIRPSTSPWGAPLVFVRKKDGSVRACTDSRGLNSVTVKDAFPLPRTEDCIDAVAGAKLFSTMDITSAYNQVPIREDDIHKTAFTTKYGLFEHVTMPFGLCNAPSTFQRLMEVALAGLQWQSCLIYLDDVIIFSEDFPEHLRRLREVLERIRQARLKLKPKKTSLFKARVKFLGHILSEEGVLPDPSNVDRLAAWPPCRKVRDVRSFLGLGNYYRRFVKGYSELVKPLTTLTKKGVPFKWSPECQQAFEELKAILMGPEIMAYPIRDGMFYLDCDACDVSIGAVLSQIQGDRERVIAYGSRTLNRPERNYCVTDRECLAVKYFCEYYKHYLLGVECFIIRTDHQALRWLLSMKEPKGRIARWIESLSPFRYQIQYRKGTQHSNADAMSRCPEPDDCQCEDSTPLRCGPCKKCITRSETMHGIIDSPGEDIARRLPAAKLGLADEDIVRMLSAFVTCVATLLALAEPHHDERAGRTNAVPWALPHSMKDLHKRQLEDPEIGPVVRWKEQGRRPPAEEAQRLSPASRHYWLNWNSLHLREGLLFRKFQKKNGTGTYMQFLLPSSMKDEVLRQSHNSLLGGHLGQKKTRGKVKQRFFWHGLREDVNLWVNHCDVCATVQKPSRAPRGPLGVMTVGAVMDRLCTDYLGAFPRTPRDNAYILVVTDSFSKWVEIFPVPDQTAITTARVILNEVIARFGCPYSLLSDRGRNYESRIFAQLCELLEIRKIRTTTANPGGNGQTERFNRTLLKMIRAYLKDNEEDWDLNLGCLAGAYRATPHESTGMTPNLMMLGREVRLPVEVMLEHPLQEVTTYGDHVSEIRNTMRRAHEVARVHLKKAAKRQKDTYDVKKCFNRYAAGDVVWYATARGQLQTAPKLRRYYEGPYVIVEKVNDLLYRIQLNSRGGSQLVHHNKLKPYLGLKAPRWIKSIAKRLK